MSIVQLKYPTIIKYNKIGEKAMFKIASWNVNSLRARMPHVLSWLNDVKPDVLALQETKCVDHQFPFDVIENAGYNAIVSGQKAYNGVAIFSREKARNVITDLPDYNDVQRRVLGVTIGDVRILNLYVPNGEHVLSTKYQYKLEWLNKLSLFLTEEIKKYSKMIILGDFNIAPEDIDVHDPNLWKDKVLCSKPERDAFHAALTIGFYDSFRLISPNEQHFSWWDYRAYAYKRNMGLRIDHILVNAALKDDCIHCHIDKRPRELEKPSDHAPIVAEFRL